MLSLKWTAEHECKKHIRAEGINARIHLVKDDSFQFPKAVEKIIRKKFSDALRCKYCVIIDSKYSEIPEENNFPEEEEAERDKY